ncbi:ATP-binding protein [Arthrospiribacter ruber]|uniref:ATP-binding protein n=1 Tax=Arthrospiribacter ruber TaxID=2487934 RepID=A0A951J1I9_9BACT|nr:ATP-binding protein [Arthrospiribacter ruber]MBW3469762.1 ATP-binding protein [Arthrospiribacter ruber]
MLVSRDIVSAIKRISPKYPILALTGPRQSGKTTLLKSLFPDYRYVSLENPDNRNFAESDPNGFLKEFHTHVIFDEVQRVPELFSYIQNIVDDRRGEMGIYVLSGSQNFHLMHSITQSLAGRVAIFKLFPFDLKELNNAGILEENYLNSLIKGYYPAIYDRDIPSKVFYSNYIETYINRDIGELVAIRNLRIFQNFLALCATRAGQLLNMNALANECGISQPTAKAWLSALEQSFITFQLYPYHKNFNKRIVKTPKLYFYDTGLLCHLLKISKTESILTNPIKGALFENMMIAEYVKQMHHQNNPQDLWFWRDAAGNEIDLLVDKGDKIDIIEFKASQTIKTQMFDGLAKFEEISQIQNLNKSLVYGGDTTQKRSAGNLVSWRRVEL